MMRSIYPVAALGLSLGLSFVVTGCVTAPPPPPVTVLSSQNCSQVTELAPVTAPVPNAKKPAVYAVEPGSDCLIDTAGQTTTGKLIALPTLAPGYFLNIASQSKNGALLPLRIQTLNDKRQLVRTLDDDRLYFGSAEMRGQIFFNAADADERFVLVTAAPTKVGRQITQNAMGANAQMVSSGTTMMAMNRSYDKAVTQTYAYNGELTAEIGGTAEAP